MSTQAVGTYEHHHNRLYVGVRGAMTLRDPHDQGGDAHISAGTYFMHHVVTEKHFHTTPEIANRIFIFPGDALRSLVAGKPRAGQVTSPAAQVLRRFHPLRRACRARAPAFHRPGPPPTLRQRPARA
ncbi:hypothetical protein ACFV23_18825 [Streptomyces sp. NPDC059627]